MARLAKISALLTIISFYGCSVTHVQPGVQAPDLTSYKAVRIGEVKVYSLEPNAEDNEPLQELMTGWQAYSQDQLRNYVERSNLQLTTDGATADTLLLDLDVNVQYGNRALRWAVGFGAGKGGVYPELTAKDANTGEVKYDAKAHADMLGGPAGGDIGELLKLKVQKLIEHFIQSAAQPQVAKSDQ